MSDLIKVSEEFHFNGKGIWLGLERSSQLGIDLTSQYVKAHEDLVSAFKAISGQTMTDFNSGIPSTPPIIDYKAKERVEKMIDDAQSFEELLKIKDDAVKHGLANMYADKMEVFYFNQFSNQNTLLQ